MTQKRNNIVNKNKSRLAKRKRSNTNVYQAMKAVMLPMVRIIRTRVPGKRNTVLNPRLERSRLQQEVTKTIGMTESTIHLFVTAILPVLKLCCRPG